MTERDGMDSGHIAERYPGAPRWVKIFAILLALPVILFLLALLFRDTAGHGPGRHIPGPRHGLDSSVRYEWQLSAGEINGNGG